MIHNALLADLLGSIEATLLLALFLFVPGYVAGWLTNVFRFREQRPALRVALSTPLAIAIVPIMTDLLGRRPPLLWAFFGLTWAAFAALAFRELRSRTSFQITREMRIAAIAVAVWAVFVPAVIGDLPLGNKLYFSTPAYDHCVRAEITAAASRRIPPANPFFSGTPAPTLRYHYFLMSICGLVTRLSGIAPRHVLYGSSVWAAIAFMSVIVIALKFFAAVQQRLARKTLIGFGLLTVTGLDLIPALYFSHFKWSTFPDPEWWNTQITSWVDVMLWTPHHLLAMLACVTAFILLRQPAGSRRQRALNVIVAGFAFASAAGLSILATFTFAVFAALWLLVCGYRRWWNEFAPFVAAGAIAILLALPYLHILLGPASANAAAGTAHPAFVRFAVRECPLGLRIVTKNARHTFRIDPAKIPATPVNLALLPISYFFELGFYFFVAVIRWKRARASKSRISREETAAWTMIAASFLIGSFLRSPWQENDLGWRCFLQAQFIFLLWAALLLDDWLTTPPMDISPRARRFAGAMLVIGVLSTVYQVISLRTFPILHDYGGVRGAFLDADRQVGKRSAAIRSVYEALQTRVSGDAVIQFNPLVDDYIPHLLYSNHDLVAFTSDCGAGFGGDASQCAPRLAALSALYGDATPSTDSLDAVCRQFGINVMLAQDNDPVWKDPQSWVWKRAPLIANDYVRAFGCGK